MAGCRLVFLPYPDGIDVAVNSAIWPEVAVVELRAAAADRRLILPDRSVAADSFFPERLFHFFVLILLSFCFEYLYFFSE